MNDERYRRRCCGSTRSSRTVSAVSSWMRGLTGVGGGMVAAATTSLPERSEAGRNYDSRYVWIRDQCFAGLAAAAARAYLLLDDAVRFVDARLLEDGPHLKPACTSTGGSVPDARMCSRRVSSAVSDSSARSTRLAEKYDVAQRQMRGNLPQAFVHALLLECAVGLDE